MPTLIELGRVIESAPVKLYMGSGQRAPPRMPQRSRVMLIGCIPYTLTNRFAVTLTFDC